MQDSPIIERRIAARVAIERPVSVTTEAAVQEGTTVNVSTSGVLVTLAQELTIWSDVTVALPGIGERGARVARRDGDRYGLVFREALTAAEFVAFTGVHLSEPEADVAGPGHLKRSGRTAPWAFGRDRFKTLKREAAERAKIGR